VKQIARKVKISIFDLNTSDLLSGSVNEETIDLPSPEKVHTTNSVPERNLSKSTPIGIGCQSRPDAADDFCYLWIFIIRRKKLH